MASKCTLSLENYEKERPERKGKWGIINDNMTLDTWNQKSNFSTET